MYSSTVLINANRCVTATTIERWKSFISPPNSLELPLCANPSPPPGPQQPLVLSVLRVFPLPGRHTDRIRRYEAFGVWLLLGITL